MNDLTLLYPIIVVQSRYGGTYEGGAWHALPNADAAWAWSDTYADYMFGGDDDAITFWSSDEAKRVGRGGTPNAAVLDLIDRSRGVGQSEDDDDTGATEGSAQEGSGTQDGKEIPPTSWWVLS
jgi:hypothetical protein